MKLHLPVSLFFALMATLLPQGYAEAVADSPNNGAIELYDTAGNVTYSGYWISSTDGNALGGALYEGNDNSTVSIDSNAEVEFSNNGVTSSAIEAFVAGGAIAAGDNVNITLNNNENVFFTQNYAQGSNSTYGGAIYASSGEIALSGNAYVEFEDNRAISSSGPEATTARGGAIYAGGALSLINNVCLGFSENTATYGGAIYAYDVDISGNIRTSFHENSATYGGAIYATSDLTTIIGNSSITFSENSVSCDKGSSAGAGAIHAQNLFLLDNSELVFERNSASSTSGNACAGAIYSFSYLEIGSNRDISFNGNSATSSKYSYGGAIYAESDSSIVDNSVVTFNENTSSAQYDSWGGAIYAYQLDIRANKTVTFIDNASSSLDSGSGNGGAIYASQDLTINLNADVTFSGNNSTSINGDSMGGAIYAADILTIIDNQNVSFNENLVSSDRYGSGGAIYARGTMNLNDNDIVTFSGNSANNSGGAIYADGSLNISGNNDVTFSGNSTQDSGGAIYASYLDISYNGSVHFSGNSSLDGGAIYADYGLGIRGNSNITFSNNTSNGIGGAIVGYASDSWAIEDNEVVTFNNNTSNYYGGAIYAGCALIVSGNGSIEFIENASNDSGGAIYARGNASAISNNDTVIFLKNTSSEGGAIFSGRALTISGNSYITFAENSADDGGGAIFMYSALTISNNNYITFSKNAANIGGAICAYGDLLIEGNDSILFEKNYEEKSGNYRLRSIYGNDGMKLAAKTGGDITFYDSVEVRRDSYFNSNYTDADGNTQSAGGDIIFSGEYAEQHLNEILAENNEGRTATADEILNSQTSTLQGNVYLSGGNLKVVDGAVLNVGGTTVKVEDGSNATLEINNAELVATNAKIEVGESATLQLSNGASITADEITIEAGAVLSLVDVATAEISEPSVAVFSMSASRAALAEEYGLSIYNVINADLTFEAGSTLMTDGSGINMTEGSILTFKATEGGEKIHLVFTLGTEYNEDGLMLLFSNADIVKFLKDGNELSTTSTILASEFFTGDYITETTTIVYNNETGDLYLHQDNVPEPTTATLSLLALAALAARRRRK